MAADIQAKYYLGTFAYGPNNFLFFGPQTVRGFQGLQYRYLVTFWNRFEGSNWKQKEKWRSIARFTCTRTWEELGSFTDYGFRTAIFRRLWWTELYIESLGMRSNHKLRPHRAVLKTFFGSERFSTSYAHLLQLCKNGNDGENLRLSNGPSAMKLLFTDRLKLVLYCKVLRTTCLLM